MDVSVQLHAPAALPSKKELRYPEVEGNGLRNDNVKLDLNEILYEDFDGSLSCLLKFNSAVSSTVI
jgi:hypothetical protein